MYKTDTESITIIARKYGPLWRVTEGYSSDYSDDISDEVKFIGWLSDKNHQIHLRWGSTNNKNLELSF